MENIKRKLGLGDRTQVKVRTGTLIAGWSSEAIRFPEICHSCLKPAEGMWKLKAIIGGSKKSRSKESKGKTEILYFEVPTCQKCLSKKNLNRSISIQASLIILFLALFFLSKATGALLEMSLRYITLVPLFLPLLIVIMYVLDKRDADTISILDIALGEDNQSLLRFLESRHKKDERFVSAKVDLTAPSSVAFLFRNQQYASLFRRENEHLLA